MQKKNMNVSCYYYTNMIRDVIMLTTVSNTTLDGVYSVILSLILVLNK